MSSPHYIIRRGAPADEDVVAENTYKMWLDIGYSPESIVKDWREKTLDRLKVVKKDLKMATFVAISVDDESNETVVGSAIVQLWDGLHAIILTPEAQLLGYIWGVYVDPPHRERGLAAKVTQACVDYCKELGCTEVRLFASDMGRSVYERIGFINGREMKFKFD
ncbi:acyl-CoA N-acyltransferase [Endogone sp. FLAS-F59071]|nr:acyl-CoA N-acyltransferase [Endogone sp. FLAS-F59071]|eukprot:RUS18928.1 acyl-CoA N-acyltransferase [Endogone sp. FLAS-F59071]